MQVDHEVTTEVCVKKKLLAYTGLDPANLHIQLIDKQLLIGLSELIRTNFHIILTLWSYPWPLPLKYHDNFIII